MTSATAEKPASTDTIEQIIARHMHQAWERRAVAEIHEGSGRRTNAKTNIRLHTETRERAIRDLVTDLRTAGYTIPE